MSVFKVTSVFYIINFTAFLENFIAINFPLYSGGPKLFLSTFVGANEKLKN